MKFTGPPGGFAQLKAQAAGIGKPKLDPLACFRAIIRLDAVHAYPHARIGVRYAREALRIPLHLAPPDALAYLNRKVDPEAAAERAAQADGL